jgi:hypothetical protein
MRSNRERLLDIQEAIERIYSDHSYNPFATASLLTTFFTPDQNPFL